LGAGVPAGAWPWIFTINAGVSGVQMVSAISQGQWYTGGYHALMTVANAFFAWRSLGGPGKSPREANECFPARTPVHTSVGLKAIEQVGVGDRVWAYDHKQLRWVVR